MLVDCVATAESVELPHTCRGNTLPLPYRVGERGRERLAAGEAVPVSARCERCDGRVFAHLVDRVALDTRLSMPRSTAAGPVEPTAQAVRPHSARVARVREFAGSPGRPALRIITPPCPACGVVPDDNGLCRCSA